MAGPNANVTHGAPQQTGRLVTVLSQSVVDWIKQRASGPRPLEFTDLSDFDGPGATNSARCLQPKRGPRDSIRPKPEHHGDYCAGQGGPRRPLPSATQPAGLLDH